MENNVKKNNKILWSFLFLLLAALTVWAVIKQNGGISVKELLNDFHGGRIGWLITAVIGVCFYVWLEGHALLTVNRSLGYKGKFTDGLLYSAADIYCSAITPSATGGQPASAYFMIKRGIPGSVATVSLLVNLIMYTLSIVTIGVLCIIFKFDILMTLPWHAQLVIGIGALVQIGLVLVFMLLLCKGKLLWLIGDGFIRLLGRLHLLRNIGRKRVKLRHAFDNYSSQVQTVSGQGRALFKVFICDFFQRMVLISISGLVCLSMGGTWGDFISVCALQAFVILGASWFPIPGAMGVTDYLLLVGFASYWPHWSEDFALHLELCSRGISFYACVLLCGGYVLLLILKDKIRKCKK